MIVLSAPVVTQMRPRSDYESTPSLSGRQRPRLPAHRRIDLSASARLGFENAMGELRYESYQAHRAAIEEKLRVERERMAKERAERERNEKGNSGRDQGK